MNWIWKSDSWPYFTWDKEMINTKVSEYERESIITDARFTSLLPEARSYLHADALARDAVSSSEMEGVKVSYDSVYSSVAEELELKLSKTSRGDLNGRSIGILMHEVNSTRIEDINENSLLHWHTLLFSGASGKMKPKHIGSFRKGPVYVMKFSGSLDSEVMYEAIPHERIEVELETLFSFIKDTSIPRIIRSAVSAAWMPLIHPFEDGNGRISRLFSDAILFDGDNLRSVSISSAIRRNSREYYSHLEELDKNENLDLTSWICWYIDIVIEALKEAEDACQKKIMLSAFMATLDPAIYNSREISILYRLASGSFQGTLTAEKWMKMTKCRSATATRDLTHLVDEGLLIRSAEGGRTTSYHLRDDII